ncbi:McKusick-Kaufman/Bardet-Biedl syndromes putative chaperonin [Trichomycterus rosablanca]|uniref:McKusick-Kaufman/Bardet-Biedl syndromes putative chaperonin n=1 Tax=Trichomycterus rosablanca TaxID=2290929 RepID=UPI002F34F625
MSRVCVKKASLCTSEPLVNPDVCRKVALLCSMFSSCYGPCGRFKLIHNSVGGVGTTTTTSSVLLTSVTFSDPLLRLVSAAVMKQTARFSDCGLFTGLVCISLVENAMSLGLKPAVASRVYSHLSEECTRFLRSDDCGCRTEISFNSVQSLLMLVHSVITSKPASMLRADEAQHVTHLTVQAFLQSIPCASSKETRVGKTLAVTMAGQEVKRSAVFPGILVDVPVPESAALEDLRPGPYKVVLFSASLSGDLSERSEALNVRVEDDPEYLVLDLLLKLGDQVVRDEVGVFVCQKVIHPALQTYLKENGLVVIERLGLALMEPLAQITGAVILPSLCSSVPAEAYGRVSGLHVHRWGSKTLLQLLPHGEPLFSTMVLCHRNETMLDELKVTCQRAEHVLRLALQEPYALLGGGCTETLLLAHIKHTSELKAAEASSALKCSRSEFLLGVEAFCSSLQSVALSLHRSGRHVLVDLTHAHCWVTEVDTQSHTSVPNSCCCGLLKERLDQDKIALNTPLKTFNGFFSPASITTTNSRPRLLDSFTAKLNALSVAVETASLVLGVKYIITDVN